MARPTAKERLLADDLNFKVQKLAMRQQFEKQLHHADAHALALRPFVEGGKWTVAHTSAHTHRRLWDENPDRWVDFAGDVLCLLFFSMFFSFSFLGAALPPSARSGPPSSEGSPRSDGLQVGCVPLARGTLL